MTDLPEERRVARVDLNPEDKDSDNYVLYDIENDMALWRVESLYDKEPETVTWISCMEKDDVFYDIGANMGLYSILAAKTHGCKTYAFEPESLNYGLLNRNIWINELSNTMVAYCLALTNEEIFSYLYLSRMSLAGSCHTFDKEVGFDLKPTNSAFAQGCLSTTLDTLVYEKGFKIPSYIKIDVDGIEHLVIDGAQEVLAEPQLKSLLIEVNTNLTEHQDMVKLLTEKYNFMFIQEQVNESLKLNGEGAFKGVANHIFFRKD